MYLKIKKYLIGLFVLSVLIQTGCKASKKETDERSGTEKSELLSSGEVSNMLTTNCYVCHNPNTNSHDDLIAPPLAGIKKRYLRASENRSEFIERMTTFVAEPSGESALMKGPISRFGLMPKTALSESEIQAIVTFIYDNDIPEPAWFEEHETEMHGKKSNENE